METGKTTKYFKYAIGEIILVVIGILIALSINNWNSNKIEKKAETKTLIELKKGIMNDCEVLQNNLLEVKSNLVKLKLLKRLLEKKDYIYNKSLDTLFGAVYGIQAVRLNKAFYEDLKASSLKLIKNDSIRLKIVNLFEDDYAFYENNFKIEMHNNEVTRPYYLQNFSNLDFRKSATPNNFNKVWTDTYYANIVHYRIINLEGNHLDTYQKTIPKMKSLVNDIEKHLSK
jgi:hypothetical protein